ncbi:mechanosensitive ion channel family protein [Romboutsia maritimum]|uniref:Mechanosensitive ion channel family protein n=2 Tax=Romboutsia maritimum TaxID=2020948 RepID=A0A371IU01_9FIRM|nr:mechanosensitive ion channel family protein [Romboutsia maritimum]
MLENIQNIDISKMNMETLTERILDWTINSGIKLLIGLIVISLGFKIIKKIVKYFTVFLEKREVDITLIKFSKSLITGALKIVLVMSTFAYWGMNLTGLAALVASAGVAVGLALQGSLSNFAGGFIILLLRPFKVGDYIQAAGYEGLVEQIGLFYTTLVSVDNKEILIPNGILSNGSLINYSAKETRRVDLKFGVGYEADILHVRRVLRDIVDRHELIIDYPEPFVGLIEHADSSLNFVVRVWCKTPDYWTIYFDLLEQVKIRFDEEQISIPYPQLDVHLNK